MGSSAVSQMLCGKAGCPRGKRLAWIEHRSRAASSGYPLLPTSVQGEEAGLRWVSLETVQIQGANWLKPDIILGQSINLEPEAGNPSDLRRSGVGCGPFFRPSLLSCLCFSLCVLRSVYCKAAEGAQRGGGYVLGHKFALERSSPLKHMCFTRRMELGHLENSLLHLMNSLL